MKLLNPSNQIHSLLNFFITNLLHEYIVSIYGNITHSMMINYSESTIWYVMSLEDRDNACGYGVLLTYL